MRGTTALIGLVTGALVAACGRGTFAPPEGGVYEFDGAMIPGSDVGPRVDAGARADAASVGPPRDAGRADAGRDAWAPDAPALACRRPSSSIGDCVLRVSTGRFGPLDEECLPRCSAATATAYRACSTSSCRTAALDADRTRGMDYFIGSVSVTPPLDCGSCAFYQQTHCISEQCPDEVDEYFDACIVDADATRCDRSLLFIDLCVDALPAARLEALQACYASVDGIAGCFACE